MDFEYFLKSKLKLFIFLFFGFLLSFSLPPYNYFVLGFIIFPSILYLLKTNELDKPKDFFIYGLLFAYGYFISSLYWISYSLDFDPEVFILKPLAIFFLPLILSLFYGLCFYILRRFFKFNYFFVLNFSILVSLTEYLRSYFTGFSWNLFVYSLSTDLHSLQILNIIGTFSLNFLVIFIFSFPYLFVKKNNIKILKRLFVLLVIISMNYLYGFNRLQSDLKTVDQEIVVVQPNEDLIKISTDPKNYIKNILKISLPLNRNKNAIFLWPEGSYSYVNGGNLKNIFKNQFKNNQKIILGANTKDIQGNIYNSFVVLNSKGDVMNLYNKIHLVPFGEFIPMENMITFLNFKKVTFGYQSFSRGKSRKVLEINKNFILPLICYEVINTGLLNINKKKFDIIFNISEDAWFDRSIGTYQHYVHSIFRSIEEGKHIFRSTNQGISASINPLGVTLKSSLPDEKTVFSDSYQVLNNNTPFSVLGNLMFLLFIFVSFLIQLFLKRYFKLS
ncbi:MAG: apolipoprotein N-acyltransferase [Candidatus Pelagibacter sp.]|nr:apolipoprotein N-acyltransferase [Candidatus Pelagibacter sp.]OUV87326.1 MAG: apolipoprotein N-acyltransferase [Pelagibacteraceae bacterium TMED136]|tara:strand:+ start:7973 stop:9478 length:1506 start_codon:yes stop_codon:yes gene_type:complete